MSHDFEREFILGCLRASAANTRAFSRAHGSAVKEAESTTHSEDRRDSQLLEAEKTTEWRPTSEPAEGTNPADALTLGKRLILEFL